MRVLIAAALCCMALAGTAVAAEPALCDKTYKVGYYDYGLKHSTSRHTGIDDDIMAELQRRGGCETILVDVPRVRQLIMLEQGSLDIGVSAIYSPEREKYGAFVYYYAAKNKILVRNDAQVTTLEEFVAHPQYKLGVVRGARYGTMYDALIKRLAAAGRIDESNDFEHVYAKLRVGRFQAILSQPVAYVSLMRSHGLMQSVTPYDWAPGEPPRRAGMLLAKASFSPQQVQR